MHAPLPLETLEPLRGLDDPLDLRVGLAQATELAALAVALVGAVEDLAERDVLAHHRGRHRLGDLLAHRERVAKDPRCVLDGLLGLDRAVGDDLRDPVVAVLVGDVGHHLPAPALVEVDVDVGHRNALRVEEPFEEQAVLERVEPGDPHGVRDERARRGATPRPDADALRPSPADEVGDDQEVAGKAHLQDHRDFVISALAHRVGEPARIADRQAAFDLLDEPGVLVLARRHRELRHQVHAFGELDVAALGDQQRVVARLTQVVLVGPQRAHLGG